MKKKVCVVTGTRAEYGLLYHLIKGLKEDDDFELQLIATGMHLSTEFGLTYQEIEKDFIIDKKIEILLSSDTSVAVNKSMALAQLSFSEALNELSPDLVIVLGDRSEIFSVVTAALVLGIPIAHLHGGELTEGAIDDSFRHAITKMSHIHFTSMDVYRKRVIQLGEQPSTIFNVGALGIDNIKKISLLSKSAFEKSINFKLGKKNLLITFHPATIDLSFVQAQFQALLNVLAQQPEISLIFTKANSDAKGRLINAMIDDFVKHNNIRCISFTSLGQLRYLSALQYVDGVVGNSSSGIIEAPSFGIGTINIGSRQDGRERATSIIDCDPNETSISLSFEKLYAESFQQQLASTINPYGDGKTAERIIAILKKVDFKKLVNKRFYDC